MKTPILLLALIGLGFSSCTTYNYYYTDDAYGTPAPTTTTAPTTRPPVTGGGAATITGGDWQRLRQPARNR